MKRVGMSDPTLLSYRDGGGCLFFFGMPFFTVGCLVLYLGITGALKTKSGQPAPMIFGILFGGVFALVGAILSFGRSGFDFNSRDKTIRSWWGLLFPFSSTLHAFNEYNEVRIKRELKKTKNSSYYVYNVSLSHNGANELKISAPTDSHDARKLAEEIAKFVELPLIDGSAEVEVRREPGQLDESLRDAAQRTGENIDISAPPAGMRSTFEARGNAVHIHIPPPPPSLLNFAPVGCATVFAGIFASTFLADLFSGNNSSSEKLVFGLVVGFFFIVLPVGGTFLGALSQTRKRWDISADPRELRIVSRGLVTSRETLIPANKLEELRLETSRGGCAIAAISDQTRATFGEGLPEEDAKWIVQVIKRAVTA